MFAPLPVEMQKNHFTTFKSNIWKQWKSLLKHSKTPCMPIEQPNE